ncbi:MAG: hypothetical protein ACOH5I_16150 [Oligoflexus sp.]
MKRSTWLFKRLRVCESYFPSRIYTFFAIFLALHLISCQYVSRQALPVAERTEFRPLSLQEGARVVAYVSEKGCAQGIPHFWLVEFQSAFGSHQIKLDYSHQQAGEETLVIFNQHRFRAQIPMPVGSSQIKKVCGTESTNPTSLTLTDTDAKSRLKTILETITPDCKIQFRDEGIYCHLEFYEASDALRRLTDAHERLVKRWQRHPYLLSRRIAFARKLAMAINNPQAQKELDRICRIVKHSIPDELPLAMRSARWFQTACLKTDPIHKEALLVSLFDAIREIESLTEELSSSSRLGMFSLRIPLSDNPSKTYWVTLKPLTVDRATDEQIGIARKTACWHPLYDQSMAEHHIADELGLLAEPSGGACSMVAREDEDYLNTMAVHYVKNSIASETEFPISNGRSKILRLPKGEYHYTIETHQGPFVDIYYPEHENPENSTGIISWTSTRPHLTISNW